MPKEFKWPCAKRKAHGPHQLWKPGYIQGLPTGIDIPDGKCPGVKVHPATMIGGRLLP